MLRRRSCSKETWSFMFTETGISIKTENFHDAYILDSATLGRGINAVVRKCTEKSTGRVYAAKILKKRRRGKDCMGEIIHEIAILELAKTSPRIVDLHEVYETSLEIILVLEYAAGGELFNLCVPDRNEALSEKQIIQILRQILEGVHFLHQNNIVHLDLKPQNVLFSSANPHRDIKIVDFGLSRKLSSTNELHEIMGTIDYTAPEILNYEPITTATDIWSIGVICYMLLTCESPFAGVDRLETFLNISQLNVDYSEDVFASVSDEAIDFLKSTLVINPKERATVDVCLSHPWLQHVESIPLCSLDATQPGETLIKYNKMKAKCNKINNDVEDKENMPEDGSTASKRLRYDDPQQNIYV